MMAGRWLWMVVVILAHGAVQAVDSGYVDAAGTAIPADWVHEDMESGGVYVEDPANGQRVYVKNSPLNKRVYGNSARFIKSNITTSPLPLLVDWNTSHSEISIYEGKLKGPHKEKRRFTIRLAIASPDLSQDFRYDAETATDGSFRFAHTWPKETGKSGHFHLFPHDSNTDRDFRLLSSESFNDLQWRMMKNIEVRLISKDGRIRGAVEIETLHLRADPRDFWGAIFSSDDSDKRHSMFGNALRLNRQSGTIFKDTGIKLGKQPLLAREVYLPGKYYVKSFGRLFGEQQISESDQLVTFTEVTHPFTVSGKVVDAAGNPMTNANIELRNPEGLSVIGSPEYIRSNLKGLRGEMFPESSITLPPIDDQDVNEALSAYTLYATTDDSGEWKISAVTMPGNAVVYASAPGYEPVEVDGLKNPNRPELPAWDDLLAGDYQTTPIVLLKESRIRIRTTSELDKHQDNWWVWISAPGKLGENLRKNSAFVNQAFVRKDEYLEMLVPGGVVISIVFQNLENRMIPKYFTVPIDPPLKPGEVREIGPLDFEDASKWVEGEGK